MITAHELFEELCSIPMLDVHTHIHAGYPTARGLDDILLYHMVVSDLYSAGCPDGARLPEVPSEEERVRRLERAIPYIPYIQNTSCWWGVRLILSELYGWTDGITAENWRVLDARIREKSQDPGWVREIMRKANIQRTVTELWRGDGDRHPDIFQYSAEWSFFTRSQWGQYDTALLELEHAWNQEEPGAPLPVTADRASLNFAKTVRTMDDVYAAIEHYCTKMPADRILSTASHLSTNMNYRSVTAAEMEKALKNREGAGEAERDIFANFIHDAYLARIAETAPGLVLQYSMGAEPLPFETSAKLRTETVSEIASIFARYPQIKFNIFNASYHQQQTLNTLARELPNVSLSGYWWHNFFPQYIRQTFGARLDMVAANKNAAFFSDAYNMDWAFAKAYIIRRQMAEVFAEKIAQGQYTKESALRIARQLVFETPQTLLGVVPGVV